MLVGIAGQIVLAVFRPDATATFVANTTQLLGLLILAASTIYQLGKQGAQLQQIEAQTNGNLTRRDAHIAALQAQVSEAGRVPVAAPIAVVEAVIDPSTTLHQLGDRI